MRRTNRALVTGALALAVVLAGCSTKGGAATEAKTDSNGVKYDVGVTDSKISVGVLTDNTANFKNTGLGTVHGNELWADEVNASGGICGRQIKLEVRDYAYKTEKAITAYGELKSKVLGYVQLLGSGALAALKQDLVTDKIMAVPASWNSHYLAEETILMTGTPYDVELINGMAWMMEQGMIKKGDTVGHLYTDGEYGGNALEGSTWYAKKHGIDLVEAKITAADVDMGASITSLKSKNVTAILLTTAPQATASALSQAQAQGMDIPFMGNYPTFDPLVLNTPAKSAFDKFYRVASFTPYSAQTPEAQTLRTAFEAKFTDVPNSGVVSGYAAGKAFGAVLTEACKAKDLTRQGMLEAKSSVKSVNTNGMTATLSYDKAGQPSTRENYVQKVDPTKIDGVTVVEQLHASKDAEDYEVPAQK
ncbi:ABC-type branched-subunit amino acid transport system substrate-binding protein [Antricoccus suffuscus]|uniref:ABC-type branched-subunit amino acid transport system substrate-binding protein n=1 Tax=Antricoccus suffuscus TaxID=1629062 RepID=A0A2T0ZJY5_9ACTN|nr:ABC transporter substrate-binding protein [Antricoccus suffuscus]PRZ36623.1 ABC-type branched-subunit amino acid transport system substrate-binding protein [Antricoccus suffuscus]